MWSQEKYLRAFLFAAEAHNTQKYPGTKLPYLVHVSLVAMEVMSAVAAGEECDADLAVQCALLHDTIEDADITHSRLEREFGLQVADGVQALSKDRSLPPAQRLNGSIERIKQQPKEIWMVKLADRIVNLQPPPNHWGKDKIAKYHEDAELILEELGAGSVFLETRLKEKIDDYRQWL